MAKKRRSSKRRTEWQKRREIFAKRDRDLKALGFASYGDYIESPLWRRRRAAFFANRPKQCEVCESVYGVIYLHHCTYHRIGRESDEDLVALCDRCHLLAHQWPGAFDRDAIGWMRAAFEERGDPAIALEEERLERQAQQSEKWRRRQRRARVRVLRVENLTAAERERYGFDPQSTV